MTDPDMKLLQGSYTRMLRFVRNIPYDEHPPLDDIYGDVPSIFAQVGRQLMQMLGSTFKPIVACRQSLTEMLSWMFGERQTVDTVRSTLGSQRRNKGFSYVSQLLMEVRKIAGRTSISSVDIRDMLLGNAWREKVVDHGCISLVVNSLRGLRWIRCDRFFRFTRPRPWLGLLMTCDTISTHYG